jgi:hypothetical protein
LKHQQGSEGERQEGDSKDAATKLCDYKSA